MVANGSIPRCENERMKYAASIYARESENGILHTTIHICYLSLSCSQMACPPFNLIWFWNVRKTTHIPNIRLRLPIRNWMYFNMIFKVQPTNEFGTECTSRIPKRKIVAYFFFVLFLFFSRRRKRNESVRSDCVCWNRPILRN